MTAYRENIQEIDAEALRDKPENYLTAWCSNDSRWLHRFLEAGRNEPMYQLTPHTEDVFAFLDRVLEQDLGFVGTESRLRLVIETLADLVIKKLFQKCVVEEAMPPTTLEFLGKMANFSSANFENTYF